MKLKLNYKSPWARTLLLSAIYIAALIICHWLAFQIRFDFNLPSEHLNDLNSEWYWKTGITFGFLVAFGQLSGLLSYFSIPDLIRLFYALGGASATFLALPMIDRDFYHVPRGVLLLDFLLSFVALTGIRLSFRLIRERFLAPQGRSSRHARRVGIIGAGDVGASLARELGSKRGLGLNPVAFFDDDEGKWQSRVHNIPVVGNAEFLLNPKLNLQLEEIIIAMPSAPAKRIGEIVKILQQTRLRFETVPSMDQLATGKVKVSQLRSVEIQDLLGREPVSLETESIRQILSDKIVMVTGAGGSIGTELCRQITSYNPRRLVLVEQSEFLLFQIEQELKESGSGGHILPAVADICDEPRMRQIFAKFKPEVVFHAAAHKHVPMMESQPAEAIKNNTLGTAQMARLAMAHGVDRFVMISTDKAINPTNVMGATKRLAEIFLQALHASQNTSLPHTTKFIAVRFGNVLGSSGSVIPIFNKQIAAGGPVKVTHPDVTRYFMTIPEAVGLVLQSGTQGSGGEIFVLDMGKPVKIVDLARQLIELSGLKPDEDIEIEFTGLRPGEKLFEELSHVGENITPTSHPKIMRFVSQPSDLARVEKQFAEVTEDLHSIEPNQLKMRLKKAVPEYMPYLT